MSGSRHLTFANLASAAALVIAVAGGGVATAGSVGKNSVGSRQIKNNSVTGKDIKEASLEAVPSAVSAQSAQTAGLAADSGDVLRATVDENGQLLPEHSEGAVSAATYAGGDVVGIIFNRSVTNCSVVGTGHSTQATTFDRLVEVSTSPASPTQVIATSVEQQNGDNHAGPLSVVVVC
jgi:hypothetical protein